MSDLVVREPADLTPEADEAACPILVELKPVAIYPEIVEGPVPSALTLDEEEDDDDLDDEDDDYDDEEDEDDFDDEDEEEDDDYDDEYDDEDDDYDDDD
ncbi:MAG: hypothetical protein AAGI46_02475 [Planctomycetota bacterium]